MRSYLPRLGEWEFIPHVGFLVPQVLERPDHTVVHAADVYQEIIGIDDEILVYYGAADTAIGVATARLGDIVPILEKNQ